MKKLSPCDKCTTLALTDLEQRLVPAVWPFGNTDSPQFDQFLETWGQYQEIPTTNPDGSKLDQSVHYHEGMDIAMPAGTPVRAVADGFIKYIFIIGSRTPYDNVVVVTDKKDGNIGWNIKHIVPDNKLKVGNPISVGQVIGEVAPVRQEISQFFPPHLHLDRGKGFDGTLVQDGGRRLLKPNMNPVLEFPSALAKDNAAPTIRGVSYRLQSDDVTNPGAAPGDEVPRKSAKYFNNLVTVDGDDVVHVGRKTMAKSQSGVTVSDETGNANIDIIVDAFDKFGTGKYNLNIYQLGFTITGEAFGESTGFIPSIDFAEQPNANSVTRNANFAITRSIYENDTRNNSSVDGPYFYIATNTYKDTKAKYEFGKGTNFVADNKKYYWNTDVTKKKAWNTTDENLNTPFNAKAEFPDDTYVITVEARDASQNVTRKDFKLLLQNYTRTITTDKNEYAQGEPITIDGGLQYRANQEVSVYIKTVDGAGAVPPNGTALTTLFTSVTPVTSNKNGKLESTVANGELAPGEYWVVADYNGDGEFTKELDAAKRIVITELPPPPPPVGVAAPDFYTYDFSSGLHVATPGVALNDTHPLNYSVVLTSPPIDTAGGVFNLNADGSFDLVLGDYGGGFPITFDYALYSDGVYLDQATVTIDQATSSAPASGFRAVTIAAPDFSSGRSGERSALPNSNDGDPSQPRSHFQQFPQSGPDELTVDAPQTPLTTPTRTPISPLLLDAVSRPDLPASHGVRVSDDDSAV